MGKSIFMAILIACGTYAYNKFIYKSPAFLAWSKFSDAKREGKCDVLQLMVLDQAAGWVTKFCSSGLGGSAASFANDMAFTPQGASMRIMRRLESETTSASGKEVKLKVVEWLGGPGAAPGPMYSPPPPQTVEVKMQDVGGLWKVVEFTE